MRSTKLTAYPGGDLVQQGLKDLTESKTTEPALLVMIAADRLEALGLGLPTFPSIPKPYEHALYAAINARNPESAHFEYNALIARIVSFSETYSQAIKQA